jgi:hypothetical protein
MYLVELRPGKEELYRTTEELAAAIRKGDVDGHSRIYHRATSKWISVTLHPQYKAIVAERPGPPPIPPLERTNWTFFNDAADSLAGANDPTSDDHAERGDDSDGHGTDPDHPWRRPLALSITGGLLILGLQLAAAGPKPPWASHSAKAPADATIPAAPAAAPAMPAEETPAPTPVSAPAPAPAPATAPTISLVSSGASWTELNRGYVSSETPSDGLPAPADAPAPPRRDSTPPLPAAPRIRTKGLLLSAVSAPAPSAATATVPAAAKSAAATVNAFMARWAAAHDSALTRLASGVRVARLNQLFASSRLSPGAGVTETRMSLAGVANFIRIYREQQAAIERRFQDAFTTTAKARNWAPSDVRQWYAKPVRSDTPTVAALTSSLVTGIDSLFGVLDAQAGTYAVTKNTIRFEDPAAAREYMALRERIVVTMDSARAVGGADHPGPMSYLLQAIGATRLPIAS